MKPPLPAHFEDADIGDGEICSINFLHDSCVTFHEMEEESGSGKVRV